MDAHSILLNKTHISPHSGIGKAGDDLVSEKTQLYTPPIFNFISTNIAKYGNPLGLKDKDCTSWADSLQIPTRGKTILYTGCEYQMTAYLQSLVAVLKKAKFESAFFSTVKGIQAATGKIGVDLTRIYTRVAGDESKTYTRLLRMAALILRRLGVDFAYLGDGEMYSGALLYEFGLFEELQQQAKRVVKQFKEAEVTRIITLTPHSAEVFQQVYPRFVDNFDFTVSPYVVTVAEALRKSGIELSLPDPMTLTLHDPCHLARSLKVTEEPREIIQAIRNLELKEVAFNKELTVCCGAPCEMVFPELSECLAARRAEELAETGAEVAATLCPFCYSNLNRGLKLAEKKIKIVDFIEVIYQALGEGSAKT